jgi:predicted MFS family arabinose efflux permease
MPKLLQFPRILILFLLVSFASVAAVLFTPALPQLTKDLQLSSTQSQWLISIFLIGYAVGPLLYGPLGNKFGRKKTIFLGLSISILGSGITSITTSFWLLSFGRFIQALGASVGFKIIGTMVGDLLKGPAATKTFAILYLGNAIVPSVGIAVGGALTDSFGWRGCFIFMTLYSMGVLALCFLLPETATRLDPNALRWKNLTEGYLRQFKNSALLLPSIYFGLGTGIVYIFASQAPFIAIEGLKLSAREYGTFNLLIAVGMSIGLLTATRIADKISSQRALLFGLILILSGALAMALCLMSEWRSGWSLFLPQTLISVGIFFTGPFVVAKAMSDATDKSNASAVFQFNNLSCAMLSTFALGALLPRAPLSLPIALGAVGLLMFFIWVRIGKKAS